MAQAIQKRKSYIEIDHLYFWTATINTWYKLLDKDVVKDIVIASLQYSRDKCKITVYGFVIMPNHIHLVWQIHELNGKECAQGSFLKYTAHAFKKWLLKDDTCLSQLFAVKAEKKVTSFGNVIYWHLNLRKKLQLFKRLGICIIIL